MEKLKHFSLFSGIESFKKALTNLGVDNELVGYSEFDKYASVALSAIHGVSEELNYGDITKIDERKVPDCDLITYGFPCQDISVAGLGKGIIEGETRSGLLFDALRIIKYKKPKYAIAENVKNLVGKKFKDDFNSLLEELDSYGYTNYYKVLNAKDYDIPQNRERVFIVSIRKDVDDGKFEFPIKTKQPKLQTYLLNEVESQYYLSKDEYKKIKNTKYRTNKRHENITKKLINGELSGFKVMDYRYDEGLRVRKNELCPTLTTRGKQSISGVPIFYENGILRFITPLESWRLMGFADEDYHKARQALEDRFYNGKDRSNSQMYKMVGNSIVVDVLEGILKNL